MAIGWDKDHSLTGDEFLDFLAWGEVMGIDLFGDQKNNDNNEYEDNEENENIDDYENNSEYKYVKERKR